MMYVSRRIFTGRVSTFVELLLFLFRMNFDRLNQFTVIVSNLLVVAIYVMSS